LDGTSDRPVVGPGARERSGHLLAVLL
jgi:hypothetical protein